MRRSILAAVAGAAMALAASACNERSAAAAVAKSDRAAARAKPTVKVDSALGPDEELRRFRNGLPRVDALEHGAPSRDRLVDQFVAALERKDTLALIRLHVTRREYAWLIYPSSTVARPPYRQPPEIAWMLAKANTETGLTRLLARRGGQKLGVVGYACDPKPTREGENTIWWGCVLRTASTSGIETTRQRLFGSIIERNGRFKFLSYKNQF